MKTIITSALALLLAACGGGSDTPPSTTPAITNVDSSGLWRGTTSSGRNTLAITLDDGTSWVLYTKANDPITIAGGVAGMGAVSGNTFTANDARDFNLEGLGILPASVTGTIVAKQNLKGSVVYPSLNQTISFTSTYDTSFDLTPSLDKVVGTYRGTAAVAVGIDTATLVIAPSGALSGTGASGCRFDGAVMPRAKGNVYTLSVTFKGAPCSNGTNTISGIAYLDAATGRVYAVALNSARTDGLIFLGTK